MGAGVGLTEFSTDNTRMTYRTPDGSWNVERLAAVTHSGLTEQEAMKELSHDRSNDR